MTSIWIDAGMYLGMFDAWQATQVQPQNLIVSRDGINFIHVFDGKPVIELGRPGEWDAGWTSPVNIPVIFKDEIRMYYSGGPRTIGAYATDWRMLPMQTGLARLRQDGFVSLDVVEGRSRGTFETLPIPSPARSLVLYVNADGLARGQGRIRVEVLRDGQVVASSSAVTEEGVRRPVVWREGSALPVPAGTLRLRFILEGTARIYSFTVSAS